MKGSSQAPFRVGVPLISQPAPLLMGEFAGGRALLPTPAAHSSSDAHNPAEIALDDDDDDDDDDDGDVAGAGAGDDRATTNPDAIDLGDDDDDDDDNDGDDAGVVRDGQGGGLEPQRSLNAAEIKLDDADDDDDDDDDDGDGDDDGSVSVDGGNDGKRSADARTADMGSPIVVRTLWLCGVCVCGVCVCVVCVCVCARCVCVCALCVCVCVCVVCVCVCVVCVCVREFSCFAVSIHFIFGAAIGKHRLSAETQVTTAQTQMSSAPFMPHASAV